MTNRFVLRAGTQDAHALLDTLDFDLAFHADYTDFLLWQGRLVPFLERYLEQNGIAMALTDWPERSRRDALLRDIADLGLAVPPLSAGSRELDHTIVDPGNSVPALWGIAYVLEGSRLGGKMLLNRLSAQMRRGHARFLGHGLRRSLWPSFVAGLDAQPFTARELQTAIDAANAVFGLFSATNPFSARMAVRSTG